MKIRGIPTSRASGELARSLMIPLTSFDEVAYTDVTIDGADEVAGGLALIKGGGGALLHEKIVASSSRCLVIVADEHKLVERLGRFPLPVEVIPFAASPVKRKLEEMGAHPVLRSGHEARLLSPTKATSSSTAITERSRIRLPSLTPSRA